MSDAEAMLQQATISAGQTKTLILLIAVYFVFFAYRIQVGSHNNSDDTLYSEMARQMVQTGNWADNQWGGAVQFEKPPLYLWSLAASGALFGWSEAALRLPGTLFALVALAALYLLMLGLGSSTRQASLATLFFASSFFFIFMARRLMTDLPMLACCLAAAAAVTRRSFIGFGIFSGLAILAKGAAAGPLLVAVFAFAVWAKVFNTRSLIFAVLIGLAVAAPWHINQSLRHGGEFWQVYLFHHVGERATGNVVPGLSLMQLLGTFMLEGPLCLFAFFGLFRLSAVANKPARIFIGLWLALALLPVLLSSTRLPHYLLPAVVPLAMICAFAWVKPEFTSRQLAVLAAGIVAIQLTVPREKFWTWYEPDFAWSHKEVAASLTGVARDEDYTATFNTTTNALTFYANRRFEMLTDDPRFYEVQDAVVLIQRAGVLKRVSEAGIAVSSPYARRFIVARPKVDREAIVRLMRVAHPDRDLHLFQTPLLEVVNDAAMGEAIP
jgi:4-amino-4-deoxy-L-arabinose transferase-like glycosyltransferase